MAATLNNTSTGTISGSSSLTISHTVGSGSNRYLEVTACCTNSSDYLAAATCAYGGVSMGSPIVTAVAGSANRFTYTWGMVAPASGTANVVITPSSGAYLDAIVRDYTGVDQSTPVAGSTKFANPISSPLSTQTLACPAGGLLADFFTARATGQTLTPGASQTRSGTTIAGGSSTSSGSTKSSSDLSWSAWTGSQACAHVGIALNAAAASPTTATLTGPTTGTTGSASSNFTVTLDAPATSTVTITPAGTVGTVTFTPATPTITAGNTSTTFTANADTDGTHSISITTSPTLTYSGSPISYVTSPPAAGDNSAARLSQLSGAFGPLVFGNRR